MGVLATSGYMPIFGIDGIDEMALTIVDAAGATGSMAGMLDATVLVVVDPRVGAMEADVSPGGIASPALAGAVLADGDIVPVCGFNPLEAASPGGGLGNDKGSKFALEGKPGMFGRLLCGAKLVFIALNICVS